MSASTPISESKKQQKVHYSQYIQTENKPDEAETKPAEPKQPEFK